MAGFGGVHAFSALQATLDYVGNILGYMGLVLIAMKPVGHISFSKESRENWIVRKVENFHL